MKQVTVLNYFRETNGTLTSTCDAYCGLKEFSNQDIQIVTIDDSHQGPAAFPLFAHYNLNNLDITKSLSKKRVIETDVLVTSSFLPSCQYQFGVDIEFRCNRVVLLDSLSFFLAHNMGGVDQYLDFTENVLFPGVEVVYLCNPWNQQWVPQAHEYYHKLWWPRLDYLKPETTVDEPFNRETRNYKRGTNKDNIFVHKSFDYARWFVRFGSYVENIGKLLYEFQYLGRDVNYSPKNKEFNDGLTYYLQYLGIDDNVEQRLDADLSKLTFTENDFLLEVVS